MPRARLLVAALGLAACDGVLGGAPPASGPPLVTDRTTRGEVTPVHPGDAVDAGASALRLDDPTRSPHVGRAPRRLDIEQFRSSLESVVGGRWTGPRTVHTPEAPSGSRFEEEADLIEFFAPTLGRPDYISTTSEVLDPTVTFSKLTTDAARVVCARSVAADPARPAAERRIYLAAQPADTLPANEAAVRRNLAALALRFWGLDVTPESDTASALLAVFRVAVAQPGAGPRDGWRAVCIDLATDARFLTY